MNRLTAPVALGIAVFLCACSDAATGPEFYSGPDEISSRRFHWTGSVAPNQRIEIFGVNGGIRARPASGGAVVVDATLHGTTAAAAAVRVEVVQHVDGITVCARYLDLSGRLIPCVPGSDSDSRAGVQARNVRVEFTVAVPPGIELIGSTINGVVTADIEGDIFASSVNGAIDLVTNGIAQASTVNGSIDASVGSRDWGRALQFTAVNGSVRVAIRRDADAWIDGRTMNGRATADFPLSITKQGTIQRIRGALGAGTWNLLMSTVNGDLSLRERH